MSKHTTGPWYYRKSKNGSEYAVYFDQQCTREHMLTYGGCGCCNESDESIESEDDARLMAAAPDLLDALESVQMALVGYTHQNEITRAALIKAQAAIFRARGEA